MKFLIIFSVSLVVLFVLSKIISAVSSSARPADKERNLMRGYVMGVDASQQRIMICTPGRIIDCKGSMDMCHVCESNKNKKAVFKFEISASGDYKIIEMTLEK